MVRRGSSIVSLILLTTVAVLCGQSTYGQTASTAPRSTSQAAEHAVVGTIQKVDAAGKTIVVRTADGAEETLKLTDRTVVRGAEAAGRVADEAGRAAGTAGRAAHGVGAAALAGKEGTEAIVHYTGEGADKTATRVEHAAKGTLKMADGTVVRMGEGAKTVVVKTAAGTEETFYLAEEAAVDTGRGVRKAADAAGKGLTGGERVTVHYTEAGGRKVAHLFKRSGG
jgi:hypothetical protein